MSLSHSPSIVTDGLICCLDAYGDRSFRGEPTINLKTSSQDSYSSYGTGQYIFHGLETTGQYNGWYKITATSTSSNRLIMSLGGITANSGTTYTASIEWVSPNNSLSFEVNGNQGMGSGLFTGQLNRYYRTFTKNSTVGNQSWYLTTPTQLVGAINNGIIYYRNVQFEQRDYFTKFTLNSRGTGVNEGGGWFDLSKSNNHASFNSGIQYVSDKLGALSFSGDYALINNNFTTNSPMTYEIIFYPLSISNSTLIGLNNGASNYDGISFLSNKIILYYGEINYMYSNSTLNTGNWYHLIVTSPTSNAKDATIYLNGFINQAGSPHTGIPINVSRIVLGAASRTVGLQPFHGYISSFKLYNRVLTTQEIKQNFESIRGRFGL